MKIEDVSLEQCKKLECRALHQTNKNVWWCGARLMGELECIHPDNRKQEVRNDTKTGS